MTFPAEIPVDDLRGKCNADYDARKIRVYQALYEGGSAMEEVKKDLLPPREVEKMLGPEGQSGMSQYHDRIKKSPYIRSIAGFVDWLVAAVFMKPPYLEVEGLDADAMGYYEGLEENADGHGTPLAELMRDTVLECLLHRRAYVAALFPSPVISPLVANSRDGYLRMFRAQDVEDWESDADGNLLWLRWHGSEFKRDEKAPWKQPEILRHIWAFIERECTTLYSAEAEWPGDTFKRDEVARRFNIVQHPVMPVVECQYRKGQWVMETCFDAVRAIFNRDASIEYLGDKFAFQMLVLTLSRSTVDNVVLPDLGALLLKEGESAAFIAPQGSVLDPLFKSAEKLRRNLLDSIHASAQNAASIPQAGRLSGDAVNEMRQPLSVLLESFARPVMQAYQQAIDRLQAMRGEELGTVTVCGLDEYNADEQGLEASVLGSRDKEKISGETREKGATGAEMAVVSGE